MISLMIFSVLGMVHLTSLSQQQDPVTEFASRPDLPAAWRAVTRHEAEKRRSQNDPMQPETYWARWTYLGDGNRTRRTRASTNRNTGETEIEDTIDDGNRSSHYSSHSKQGEIRVTGEYMARRLAVCTWEGILPRLSPEVYTRAQLVTALQSEGSFQGQQELDGRTYNVFKLNGRREGSSVWMWVAPDLGHLVIRAEEKDASGAIMSETVASDFRRPEGRGDVWVPFKVVQNGYLVRDGEHFLARTETITVEQFQVNPEFAPKVFTREFPSGTTVLDRVEDRTYVVTE